MAHLDEIENPHMNGSIQTQNGPMNKTLHATQFQNDRLYELLGRSSEILDVSQESIYKLERLYPLLEEICDLSRSGNMNIGSTEKEELWRVMNCFGETVRHYEYMWEALSKRFKELVK